MFEEHKNVEKHGNSRRQQVLRQIIFGNRQFKKRQLGQLPERIEQAEKPEEICLVGKFEGLKITTDCSTITPSNFEFQSLKKCKQKITFTSFFGLLL